MRARPGKTGKTLRLPQFLREGAKEGGGSAPKSGQAGEQDRACVPAHTDFPTTSVVTCYFLLFWLLGLLWLLWLLFATAYLILSYFPCRYYLLGYCIPATVLYLPR